MAYKVSQRRSHNPDPKQHAGADEKWAAGRDSTAED